MKRNALIIGVVLSVLASACASQATPTISSADVKQTAVAAAFQTQAANPSDTTLPPTDIPTQTLLPTETPLPSVTPELLITPATEIASIIPTFTPQSLAPTSSSQNPCNHPLTSWQGPSATLTVTNATKPKGTITLSLYVTTELGECGYLYVYSDSISGPVGQYSAFAFVTGKKNFRVSGGFRITEGGWIIIVRNDTILALGSCYPNC